MDDREKRGAPANEIRGVGKEEKIGRREAMKRIAKGIALVGSLGLTAAALQGQGECGYVNYYVNSYYNYSNAYYNYYDYSNYYNYYNYYNYSNSYFNHFHHYRDHHH